MDNYRQAVESPKSWDLMGYFCPKNALLQPKHIQRIYFNITFNFLREISPNDCRYRNHMSFFTTQSLYISKWKFSDLSLLALKFTKFLMSFLEPRLSFSPNFASLFSVIRLTLLYFFISIFICFGQKDPIKVQIFRLSTVCMKINQIPNVFFKPQRSFPLNFASPFSDMVHNFSEII